MKQIKTVLKFELGNYFGSKSYIISTILLAIICACIMFGPRIKDMVVGGDRAGTESESEEMDTYAFYDPQGIMDADILAQMCPDVKIEMVDSEEAVKSLVKEEKAKVGYVVNSVLDYDYYLFNKGLEDDYKTGMEMYLRTIAKKIYCESRGLDFNEMLSLDGAVINGEEIILGKDSTENYWYCYTLNIVIFMLIVMYGTTIATSVANEKGNRSIEVLVTTTNSKYILFGKVFAGAIATFFQVGLILGSLLLSYNANKDYWPEGFITSALNIPGNVLAAFAVFGLGGFLIYAFMYGALGALVSKVEDLNKTAGTAQMIVMIVYFAVLFNLTNVDGAVIKVCSFLPISSYAAMFSRIAMGTVATWEIVVSAVILYISVIGVGIIGGMIFRNSTLRYGNPIKISRAFKEIFWKKGTE